MLFQMTNLGFIEDNRFPFRENEGAQAVLVGESDAANMCILSSQSINKKPSHSSCVLNAHFANNLNMLCNEDSFLWWCLDSTSMLLECINVRSVQPTVLTDENEQDATQRHLGMWIYEVLGASTAQNQTSNINELDAKKQCQVSSLDVME